MSFVDIQINGYAGVDFLGPPITPEQFEKVVRQLRADRVRAILPTITTDDIQMIALRVANLRRLIDQDRSLRALMPAFHIEGPFISPEDGYRGAHPAEWVRPATPEAFAPVVEAAGGWDRIAMVTLAPEGDHNMRTTRWLTEHGTIVAVGHTNATLDQLRAAEDAGAAIYTHFGNGCAHMVERHDNVLNRAMSLETMRFSLIADGHHLPWFLLKNWIRYFGIQRCVFTTDAVSPAAAPPGRYTVGKWELEVGSDRRVQPAGKTHLAGSALTMPEAYENAIKHVGLTPAQARALTCDQPAQLVRRFLVD